MKRGPDSRFIVEANFTRSSPNSRQSRVINLMNQTRVTQPESNIKSNTESNTKLLAKFFSIKVKFLLESDNKVIIIQKIGIGLDPDLNIRPLFDPLVDPE